MTLPEGVVACRMSWVFSNRTSPNPSASIEHSRSLYANTSLFSWQRMAEALGQVSLLWPTLQIFMKGRFKTLRVLVIPGSPLQGSTFSDHKVLRNNMLHVVSWRIDSVENQRGPKAGMDWLRAAFSFQCVWNEGRRVHLRLDSGAGFHSVGRLLPSSNCCHDLAGVKKGHRRLSWRARWLACPFCLCRWTKDPSARSPWGTLGQKGEPQFSWALCNILIRKER